MVKCVVFTVFLLLSASTFAQRLTGYQLSNYAGTNSLYLNPSSIAGSRWGMYVNLFTTSFQAYPQPSLPVATVPFAKANLRFRGQDLAIKQVDIRLPGVMLQLKNNQAIALTTRYRSDINLTGGYDLVRWFRGNKVDLPTAERSVQLNADAFSEIAVSYAASVLESKQHFLKVGGTYKLIRGFQTSTLTANGTFGAPAEQLSYSLTGLQTNYSNLGTLTRMSVFDALLGSVPGTGNGFDLGFTYEFRPEYQSSRYMMDGKSLPDPALTNYQLRLGVALMDIGSIRYKDAGMWRVPAFTGVLQQAAVQPPKTPTEIRDAVAQSLNIVPEGRIGDLTVKLPQTLSVLVDAQVRKDWFVGGVWWKPANASAAAQHRAELISIGPRYETADREISVTGNYWRPLGKFSIGTHARYKQFTLGTDNLIGLFIKNGMSAHLFAGVALTFGPKRPADRDGDAVSDKLDRCPEVPGVWAFQGCPDTDKDGIQDKDDNCPQEAGPVATKGCPDSDKDGVLDKNDACPTEAGLAKFNGCPDTDRDGVVNKDDDCPTVAGLPALGGCPDTDADGLRDKDDTCPREKGLTELGGCPLKAVAHADSGLAESDKTVLTKLSSSWLLGPKSDLTTLAALKLYLTANQTAGAPKRIVTLEFSGANQEQLNRVMARFNDELSAYFGTTQSFQLTTVLTSESSTGLKVGLITK